jgi:hypothetical protein
MKPAPPPVHVDEAEAIRLLVDTEDEQPCSWEGCAREVEWGLECLGCGCFSRYCDGHQDFMERQSEHGAVTQCNHCRYRWPRPVPWVPL